MEQNISLQSPEGESLQQNKKHRFWATGGFDIPFLMVVLILLSIGLVMLFSASYTYAYYNDGDSLYYIKRQLIFAVLGLVAMFVIAKIDYHALGKFALPLLLLSYVLLVLVLFVPQPSGYSEYHRWITIPGVTTFQPSEIAKFAIILYMAWHIDRHYKEINSDMLSRSRFLVGINSDPGSKIKIKGKTVNAIYYALILLSTL